MIGKIGKMAILALVVMLFIYGYKKLAEKVNIPVFSQVATEV